MKVKYFKTDDGYMVVTDKSPKDFKGVLYICKHGTDPTNVKEDVFEPGQVQKLREIAKGDMPAEWLLAFGYHQPVQPKPAPVEEIVEEPLFNPEEPYELWSYIPVKRQRQPIIQGNRTSFDIGLIIGLIIMAIFMYFGFL